jgi:crotonobetainyl-CoA:carnitine CoA-transferase CaiB-like acyl-CoA transferase
MAGPLAHLRVLDLTRVLAGPWCTQTLGDLGADVIKIERPDTGDDTRAWGPAWIADAAGNATTDSAYFSSCNRNKRSVTVDISKPDGQTLLRELAAQCDILVENYKLGDLKRYGLDYATLAKINPKLVYCSITAYGQDGPYAERPGYDSPGSMPPSPYWQRLKRATTPGAANTSTLRCSTRWCNLRATKWQRISSRASSRSGWATRT